MKNTYKKLASVLSLTLAVGSAFAVSGNVNAEEGADAGVAEVIEATTEIATYISEETTAAETAAPETTATEAPTQAAAQLIAVGTYYSTGSFDGYREFTFYSDEPGGRFIWSESGMGMGFQYELDGTSAVFHMGAVDQSSYATVEYLAEGGFDLKWSDGTVEHFSTTAPTAAQDTTTAAPAATTTGVSASTTAAATTAKTTTAAATTTKQGDKVNSPKTGDAFPVLGLTAALAAAGAVGFAVRKKD